MSRPDPEQATLPFKSNDARSRLLLLLGELGKETNRKDLTWLGKQLGKLTNRRPFSYKYLHSVLHGSLEAGWPLNHAIEMAFLRQDGVSSLQATATEQQVYANEDISGMYVMGEIKTCAEADCFVQFVDNHPKRKYCPFCRPPERRNHV
jgi:hypothetical protein